MIYDTFLFCNELDLLEIRLNELYEFVDKFVLVESHKTFSGQSKPLYYLDNKRRFMSFADKIIRVIVSNYDRIDINNSWQIEKYSRNYILQGLEKCKPDDVIMLSDVDEIPRASTVQEYLYTTEIKTIEHQLSYYYLNCVCGAWKGTRVFHYGHLLVTCADLEQYRHTNGNIIKNGGWHFSYLGGVKAIQQKIYSYAHTELNREEFTNAKHITACMNKPCDLFGRSQHKYKFVPLDDSFPKHVVKHQDRYQHLIKGIQ